MPLAKDILDIYAEVLGKPVREVAALGDDVTDINTIADATLKAFVDNDAESKNMSAYFMERYTANAGFLNRILPQMKSEAEASRKFKVFFRGNKMSWVGHPTYDTIMPDVSERGAAREEQQTVNFYTDHFENKAISFIVPSNFLLVEHETAKFDHQLEALAIKVVVTFQYVIQMKLVQAGREERIRNLLSKGVYSPQDYLDVWEQESAEAFCLLKDNLGHHWLTGQVNTKNSRMGRDGEDVVCIMTNPGATLVDKYREDTRTNTDRAPNDRNADSVGRSLTRSKEKTFNSIVGLLDGMEKDETQNRWCWMQRFQSYPPDDRTGINFHPRMRAIEIADGHKRTPKVIGIYECLDRAGFFADECETHRRKIMEKLTGDETPTLRTLYELAGMQVPRLEKTDLSVGRFFVVPSISLEDDPPFFVGPGRDLMLVETGKVDFLAKSKYDEKRIFDIVKASQVANGDLKEATSNEQQKELTLRWKSFVDSTPIKYTGDTTWTDKDGDYITHKYGAAVPSSEAPKVGATFMVDHEAELPFLINGVKGSVGTTILLAAIADGKAPKAAAAEAFLDKQAHLASTWKSVEKALVDVPLGFLHFRIIRVRTGMALWVIAGEETGFSLIRHGMVNFIDNDDSQTAKVSVRFKPGCFVLKPRNIVYVPNVLPIKYEGGAGVRALKWDDVSVQRYRDSDEADDVDMITVVTKISDAPSGALTNITGAYNGKIVASGLDGPEYATAQYYTDILNWSNENDFVVPLVATAGDYLGPKTRAVAQQAFQLGWTADGAISSGENGGLPGSGVGKLTRRLPGWDPMGDSTPEMYSILSGNNMGLRGKTKPSPF